MMKDCSECIHVKVCGLKHAMFAALVGYTVDPILAEICPEYLTLEQPKEVTKKAPVRRKK